MLTVNGQVIENVESFKFLGTTISASLKWQDNLRGIIKNLIKIVFLKTAQNFLE